MIRFSVSLLFVLMMAPSSLAQSLDGRFRPFIEAAYELRIAQGALDASMHFDAKSVKKTVATLRGALDGLDDEYPHVLTLLAEKSGPNTIMVAEFEEISRRLGNVTRSLKDQGLIEEGRKLRDSLKKLLHDAYERSKQGAPKEAVEKPLSKNAESVLEKLKALGKNPSLIEQLKNPGQLRKLVRANVWSIFLDIMPLHQETLYLDDVIDVMKALEDYSLLARDEPQIVRNVIEQAYEIIIDRVLKGDRSVMEGRIIMAEGAKLLLKHLVATGEIPQSLDVTVIPDISYIEKTLVEKLNKPETKRFFIIVYSIYHASLIYVDRSTGPLRALVVDSTGSLGAVPTHYVDEALHNLNGATYMVETDRQADTINCLSFVLEDLKFIAHEPDIFAKLKAEDAQFNNNWGVLECLAPGLGLTTQKLSKLPEQARRNCIVKRKGFEREDRDHFIERNTHIRLVHDKNLGGNVDKEQYLAMDKKAAENRLTLLRMQFNLK